MEVHREIGLKEGQPMNCKYCGKQMEHDSTDGIGYSESHSYTCECGAQMTRFENGQEDSWFENGHCG